MALRPLRLATRKSLLATTQSGWVKKELQAAFPGIEIEFVKITTKGDKILDAPLAQVGGKGLFVKEIEEALLRGEADFAVHSLKDVPTEIPEGLEASIFPARNDPRDALVSREGLTLSQLSTGALVGTSSLRRLCQLRYYRPDFRIKSLRGNLDTRLRKLEEGRFDAIVVAAAGMHRLGFTIRVTEFISTSIMIPAVGQGALALEFRSNDLDVKKILKGIHDTETEICVSAERAFLAKLQGGCQVPIGAHAKLIDGKLRITGFVGDENGMRIIMRDAEGLPENAVELGNQVAAEILEAGGDKLLMEIYGS